jgi:outer membrane protein TolC
MKRIVAKAAQEGFSLLIPALLLIASAGTLLPLEAMAEEKGVQVLTLEEALQIAAEKNRDIQKAREYRNWVEGRYVEERAAALPNFLISMHASESRDESQKAFGAGLFPIRQRSRAADLGLSQAIFTWGQVGAAVRAAKVGIATADDQLRIFRQAALRDVSTSFYDILLAKAFHTIAIQNLEQKARHYDETQKRFAAGVATDYDVLAWKVEVDNARPEVIRTENLILISRDRLRFLVGGDVQEVDVRGSLEAPIGPYRKYEEAIGVAARERPDLSDLRHRIDVGKELVKIANAGDKPRLDFKAGIGWHDLKLGLDHAEGTAWTAGLFVTYPIFDGLRTRGKVAQAKSEVTTLKIEEAKLLDSISLQVRDAVNAVHEAGEIVRALSETVAQAERLLSMVEKGYEYGVKTRLDVDDVQLNLTRAQTNLARAKRDYLVARVNLEWVMGTLGEKQVESSKGKEAQR